MGSKPGLRCVWPDLLMVPTLYRGVCLTYKWYQLSTAVIRLWNLISPLGYLISDIKYQSLTTVRPFLDFLGFQTMK